MKKIIQVTPLFFKMSFLTLLFFVIAAPSIIDDNTMGDVNVTPLATDDENNISSANTEEMGVINTKDGIKPSTFGLQNPKTDAVTDTEVNRLHAPAGQDIGAHEEQQRSKNITEPERFEGMGAEMLRTEPERFEGMGAGNAPNRTGKIRRHGRGNAPNRTGKHRGWRPDRSGEYERSGKRAGDKSCK